MCLDSWGGERSGDAARDSTPPPRLDAGKGARTAAAIPAPMRCPGRRPSAKRFRRRRRFPPSQERARGRRRIRGRFWKTYVTFRGIAIRSFERGFLQNSCAKNRARGRPADQRRDRAVTGRRAALPLVEVRCYCSLEQ